jgi:hypothetical protein
MTSVVTRAGGYVTRRSARAPPSLDRLGAMPDGAGANAGAMAQPFSGRVRGPHCGHTGFMGIGTSIFLIALGAILKYAVTASVSGIHLATVGVILMVVGVVGLIISLLMLMQAGRGAVVRDRVIERDPYREPYV